MLFTTMKKQEENKYMEVVMSKNDSQCKWFNNQVIQKVFPDMIESALDPNRKTKYMIKDWISNDHGRVGADLGWLKQLGLPVIETYKDLPKNNNFIIVNTGYDSIIEEEKVLKEKNIEIEDRPCPYVRKLRTLFENIDEKYQYILLCEKNHILIKNFKSLFPEDMILVQMGNYKERIKKQWNGKPIVFVPYVTFLPRHIDEIADYIHEVCPNVECQVIRSTCMWASSPVSPITEIKNMSQEKLEGIKDALVTATKGSSNKSLMSLCEILEERGLNVVKICSLKEYRDYERKHKNDKVLLVRSPIPNKAEKEVMLYIQHGLIKSRFILLSDNIKLYRRRKKVEHALAQQQ